MAVHERGQSLRDLPFDVPDLKSGEAVASVEVSRKRAESESAAGLFLTFWWSWFSTLMAFSSRSLSGSLTSPTISPLGMTTKTSRLG